MNGDLLMQSLVSGLAIGCVYGLIGIGFCVIYNASGIVNFAQGSFVMLGGMLTHVGLVRWHLPYWVAAVVAVVAVAVLGVVIERIVVRPLWRRRAPIFVMILATLAAQIVIERLTFLLVDDQPKTLPVFTDLPPLKFGAIALSYQTLWIVAGSLAIVAGLALFFRVTLTGKAMRACAIDREAALLQGIPVAKMLALAFALSAGLGAVAGILLTPTQYTAFNVGVPFAISGFVAAIIGGFGRPFGAFVGGLMLGVVQSVAILSLGSGLKSAAALSVLLIFLFFRPAGIFGVAK